MKFLLISASLGAIMLSCNGVKDTFQSPSTQEIQKVETTSEKSEVVKQNEFFNEIGLNALVFAQNAGKKKATWQDYDNFYKSFINNKKWQNHQYFEHAKQNCFFSIVRRCKLGEDDSPEAKQQILYYLSEMQKSSFVHPILAVTLLNTSSLTNDEKQEYAKTAFAKSQNQYQEDILSFEKGVSPSDKQGIAFLQKYKSSVTTLSQLKD